MSIVDLNTSGDSSGLKQLDELIKLLLNEVQQPRNRPCGPADRNAAYGHLVVLQARWWRDHNEAHSLCETSAARLPDVRL